MVQEMKQEDGSGGQRMTDWNATVERGTTENRKRTCPQEAQDQSELMNEVQVGWGRMR